MSERYRVEHGAPVIDVRISKIERLFDNRDPAPFRERDLDPDLVEYLRDTSEDQLAVPRLRVLFWLDHPCEPAEVELAYRSHFAYELERGLRVRRRQWRTGWIGVAIALVAIVGLMSLGELVERVIAGSVGAALGEALLISGWVLMWKPIEVLVYDSIPWRRERRLLRKLLDATVETRVGATP